ncbi:MAG: hypothetical protein LBU18_07635, partial [Treponema sp.]|nr:hypothetical protein [Treponema sp.]
SQYLLFLTVNSGGYIPLQDNDVSIRDLDAGVFACGNMHVFLHESWSKSSLEHEKRHYFRCFSTGG